MGSMSLAQLDLTDFQRVTYLICLKFLLNRRIVYHTNIILYTYTHVIPLSVSMCTCIYVGIVAVSCGENYRFNERVDLSSKLLTSHHLILIWSFADPIRPVVCPYTLTAWMMHCVVFPILTVNMQIHWTS